MLRHAYYKAYFPVDSGTPPLELAYSGDHLEENPLPPEKVPTSLAF